MKLHKEEVKDNKPKRYLAESVDLMKASVVAEGQSLMDMLA